MQLTAVGSLIVFALDCPAGMLHHGPAQT